MKSRGQLKERLDEHRKLSQLIDTDLIELWIDEADIDFPKWQQYMGAEADLERDVLIWHEKWFGGREIDYIS